MARSVMDLHCDTLMKIPPSGNLDEIQKSHLTLEGMCKGGVVLQCFASFVPTGLFPPESREEGVRQAFDKLYTNYRNMMACHADVLFPVLTREDIGKCGEDGKIGVLLTIEDGGVMGDRIGNVKEFYDKGVRLVTLTWNHENPIGYPNSDDPAVMGRGLTEFGREVVTEMERLGMVVDVSHVSDGMFWDVAQMATKPFVASHSNARAVCGHKRNMTDEMIRKLADQGGIMGLNLCPAFLGQPGELARLEDMVKHILHIRNVGGTEVLALGSDFDGIEGKLEISGPQDWPKLEAALKQAGLSEEELEKMWHSNARRVLQAVLAE